MHRHINIRSAKLVLRWCKWKYGPSQFADIRTLKVVIDRGIGEHFGQYIQYDNLISVNPDKFRSLVMWCNIIIHEYVHFTQDMREYFAKYGNRYRSHPYEIKANYIAKRDQWEARRWLLTKL